MSCIRMLKKCVDVWTKKFDVELQQRKLQKLALSPALKKPLSLATKRFFVVSKIPHVMLTGVVRILLSDT